MKRFREILESLEEQGYGPSPKKKKTDEEETDESEDDEDAEEDVNVTANVATVPIPITKQPLKRRKKSAGKLCGLHVFDVDEDSFTSVCRARGHKKYDRWKLNFNDLERGSVGDSIRNHFQRSRSKPLIIRNRSTGAMIFVTRDNGFLDK